MDYKPTPFILQNPPEVQMAIDDINPFYDWLKKLYSSGKSEYEIKKILSGVTKQSSKYIYQAITLTLTKNDFEKIKDEKNMNKIEKIFKKRTGLSIEKLVNHVQEYLLT